MQKISVIVPIFKVEKYLDRCVESIVNQTYKNLEIILVNDGSPDNCPKMCDEWANKDNRIKVIHKKNGGVSSARNVGIDNATGNLISFVDSDDYLDFNYFEKMIDETADLVVCGYKVHKNIGRVQKKHPKYTHKELNMDKYIAEAYIHEYFTPIWNKLYQKDLIKDLRFNENCSFGEDFLFNMDYIKNCNNVKIIGDSLYNYI